jgi:ornithine cyclodeaminase/alanine dehydrogenase-like protein (mu-crystallin family)
VEGDRRAVEGAAVKEAAAAGSGTLILSRSDVERLLTPDDCIAAVEDAFRRHALGHAPAPGVLGFHAADGSFHIKAAQLTLERAYFAAKANANFPHNGARHGLPTIQGVVVLCDAGNGVPLAVMDSMALTALRTAAATAVAAKYLARETCDTVLICGCGAQAREQLRALLRVRRPRQIRAFDLAPGKAAAFCAALGPELAVAAEPVDDLARAAGASDIVITCTTATRYFITRDMVRPGTFVAGVGADNEHKQELAPRCWPTAPWWPTCWSRPASSVTCTTRSNPGPCAAATCTPSSGRSSRAAGRQGRVMTKSPFSTRPARHCRTSRPLPRPIAARWESRNSPVSGSVPENPARGGTGRFAGPLRKALFAASAMCLQWRVHCGTDRRKSS